MISKTRSLQSLILVLALTASAFAQRPRANEPSAARLHQIVEYLASDSLEGRRTGTPGANGAAHYIAGEFSLLGLRPGMQTARTARTRGENRARYLQSFPYVAGVELGKANEVKFLRESGFAGVQTLGISTEWMPLGFSSNGSVAGGMSFVGFGITAAELSHNDYDGVNVSGRIALALSGTPDGDNPHGNFARYEDVRWKAIAARNAGAKALIVVAREANFKDDRLSHLRYDNNAGDAGLPVLVMSRSAVDKILGVPALADMEQIAAAKKQATASIPGGHFNININLVRQDTPSFNVVGILPGSDPKLKDETIVIGAHYDHLGLGGEGSLAPREGEIHHGADDNASGVAGLLELARMFAQGPKPRRTIVFIAFSGEEEGLIGSNYYVNHPIVPLANTVAMINLDMIGRLKDKSLIVGGVGTAQEWRDKIAAANNFPEDKRADGGTDGTFRLAVPKALSLTLNEDGLGPSDHSSFYLKQIPVLFFWTGTHSDYHKPSDTAEKINYEGESRIVSFVAGIIRDIDKSDKRPTYTVAKVSSTGRASGFRIYLGTIPNYADSNDGLLLDGVRDDSPAAKAGLKAGDKIVKIAGRDVKNVYDYTYALGEMKAGQEYEIEVMRGSGRLKLKITPEARK